MLAWLAPLICLAVLVTCAIAFVRLNRAADDSTVVPGVRPQDLVDQRLRFEGMFREAWIAPSGPAAPPHRTTECIKLTDDGQLSRVRGAGTGDARWDAAVTAAMAQVMARLGGGYAAPGIVCFGAPPEP
jgi:hypothetical protein